MPHYGLMDATQMTEENAALRRARLHLQGGKRRLQEGLAAAGVAALYDSVLFGMRYYITKHKRCTSFVENIDLWDVSGLFHALTRAGIFDDPLAFNRFSLIVERALWQESFLFDPASILAEVERMLTKLGVIPFNETIPPSESLTTINRQANEDIVY
ncbi:MAG TPA: hypothetical protein VK206_14560 [Anaerolineales bacterium]|nr:hypothetical protein [Anaerolineales bacterium]